jgi:hypothetical protein
MHRTRASVREAARPRWLWVTPIAVLLSLTLLVMAPGLLVHWQGHGTADRSPRPLTRVELVDRPASPIQALATVEPAAGRALR